MPRIRQNAEAYARKDFQKAIGKAQVDADLTQKKMLAETSGIPYHRPFHHRHPDWLQQHFHILYQQWYQYQSGLCRFCERCV